MLFLLLKQKWCSTMDANEHELYAASFVDLNWVKCWGLGKENALDYFACSQFYDLKCNNEKLRMQNRPLSDLAKMVGIEYVLERNEEHVSSSRIIKALLLNY